MKWKKFVLIGDSNTQFGFSREGYWVSELANLLQRKCDVINRGFSGYNTTHLKSILPTIMSEFDVDDVCGVTIMVGSNDSANNDIQHIPLEEYGENIRAMIDYLINDYKLERKRFFEHIIIQLFKSRNYSDIYHVFKIDSNNARTYM